MASRSSSRTGAVALRRGSSAGSMRRAWRKKARLAGEIRAQRTGSCRAHGPHSVPPARGEKNQRSEGLPVPGLGDPEKETPCLPERSGSACNKGPEGPPEAALHPPAAAGHSPTLPVLQVKEVAVAVAATPFRALKNIRRVLLRP